MTITNPRKASTDSSRGRAEPESAGLRISGARPPVWGVDATTGNYHNGPVPSDAFSDLACRFGARCSIAFDGRVDSEFVRFMKSPHDFDAVHRDHEPFRTHSSNRKRPRSWSSRFSVRGSYVAADVRRL